MLGANFNFHKLRRILAEGNQTLLSHCVIQLTLSTPCPDIDRNAPLRFKLRNPLPLGVQLRPHDACANFPVFSEVYRLICNFFPNGLPQASDCTHLRSNLFLKKCLTVKIAGKYIRRRGWGKKKTIGLLHFWNYFLSYNIKTPFGETTDCGGKIWRSQMRVIAFHITLRTKTSIRKWKNT